MSNVARMVAIMDDMPDIALKAYRMFLALDGSYPPYIFMSVEVAQSGQLRGGVWLPVGAGVWCWDSDHIEQHHLDSEDFDIGEDDYDPEI